MKSQVCATTFLAEHCKVLFATDKRLIADVFYILLYMHVHVSAIVVANMSCLLIPSDYVLYVLYIFIVVNYIHTYTCK